MKTWTCTREAARRPSAVKDVGRRPAHRRRGLSARPRAHTPSCGTEPSGLALSTSNEGIPQGPQERGHGEFGCVLYECVPALVHRAWYTARPTRCELAIQVASGAGWPRSTNQSKTFHPHVTLTASIDSYEKRVLVATVDVSWWSPSRYALRAKPWCCEHTHKCSARSAGRILMAA